MHKLLFDQNLSYKIIKQIEKAFPDSTHVRFINLATSDDYSVWQYAKDHAYSIVTQDIDFNDINILYGFPPKIIRINTGNTATQKIIKLIEDKVEVIKKFLDDEKVGYLELD